MKLTAAVAPSPSRGNNSAWAAKLSGSEGSKAPWPTDGSMYNAASEGGGFGGDAEEEEEDEE